MPLLERKDNEDLEKEMQSAGRCSKQQKRLQLDGYRCSVDIVQLGVTRH